MVVTLGMTTAELEVPDAAKPPPVQDVALVELQERVDRCPAFTDVGLADNDAVGAGGGGGGGAPAVVRWMPVLACSTNIR